MYMLFMNEKLTRGSIFYENCHFAKQTKFSSAFICSIILALYCFKKVGEKLLLEESRLLQSEGEILVKIFDSGFE